MKLGVVQNSQYPTFKTDVSTWVCININTQGKSIWYEIGIISKNCWINSNLHEYKVYKEILCDSWKGEIILLPQIW